MKKALFTLYCATALLVATAQQRYGVEGFVSNGLCYNITGASTVEVISCRYMGDCPVYPATVVVPETVGHNGHVYTVTRIDDNAFKGTVIRDLTLPPTIEEIGCYAFAATDIRSIELPAALHTIGSYAFYNCSHLTTAHLPATVSSIGTGAFSSTAIETFSVDPANSHFCVVEGMLCNADTTILVATPPASHAFELTLPTTLRRIEAWAIGGNTLMSVTLPEGLREIGEGAFPTTLDSLNLPASVCRIEGNPVGENPSPIFVVTVDEGNSHYTFADGRLTSADGDTLLLVIGAKGNYSVPVGVKVLANELFRGNRALTSVILPEGLTDIGEGAFSSTRCTVNFPSTLRSIGQQAFMQNSGLGDVVLPAGLHHLGSLAFYYSSIKSVVLPDSLTVIGEQTFCYCTKLTSVQLGSCLEHIYPEAFFLTKLNTLQPLPASLRTVGYAAFSLQVKAEYVDFLGSPDTIGMEAFSTSKVKFRGDTPPVIYDRAFWCADSVIVPCGRTTAYQAQPGLATANIVEDCDGISGIDAVTANVFAEGRTVVVADAAGEAMEVYGTDGRRHYSGPARTLTLSAPGLYLVRLGTAVKKLLLR